jgi:myo-inositol-1(or 4)-monophosphatase
VTVDGDELAELGALACRLAVEAGDAALAGRRTASLPALTPGTKSTATDLVTAYDKAAEALIVAGITATRPADGIVGEEGTNRDGTSGVSWFIDPIDGTTNFVYDLPMWSTSVAAGDADGMLVGAVYLPALGELFAATRGGGATLDGRPIHCSDRADLALALVATGFGYEPARRRRQGAIVADLIGSVRDIRRLGSAAIDLCYVAAGRYDAYFETGLNAWDAAAGELIAREAGCRTGDHRGGPPVPDELLVAAPAIFDDLQRFLAGTVESA